MLPDWYSCTVLRLTPASAQVYLATLEALSESSGQPNLVALALTELRRSETGLALYALPKVLAALRATGEHPGVATRAQEYFADIVNLVSAGQDELRAAFSALGGPAAALAARLADLADAIGLPAQPVEPGGEPYHDLLAHPTAVAAAALAHELALRTPAQAAAWLEGGSAFLSAARAGVYGRLSFILAVKTLALVDRSPDTVRRLAADVWAHGNGSADLEPDLVDAAVHVLFGAPGSAEPPDLARLELEAVTGIGLDAWRAGSPVHVENPARSQAFTRLGGRNAEGTPLMAAVLWEAALWSLAAQTDPERTSVALRRWWQAPPEVPAKPVIVMAPVGKAYHAAWLHMGLLIRLRGRGLAGPFPQIFLKDGSLEHCNTFAASLLGSPWLHRTDGRWDMRPSATTVFPRAHEAEQLVRASAATVLATRLLRRRADSDGAADDEHLVAMLYHLGDVLADVGIRPTMQALRSNETVGQDGLPYPLQNLMNHTASVVQRAARGTYPEIAPRRLAEFLTDEDGAVRRNADRTAQWRRLFPGAGHQIAVNWLKESMAGGGDAADDRPGGWFSGPAPARALLDAVLEADRPSKNANMRKSRLAEVVQAARFLYPGQAGAIDLWDWHRDRDELDTYRVNQAELLLSPPYSVEVWDEFSARLGRRLVDTAGFAMATVRLAALLSRPELGDRGFLEGWVADWLDQAGAISNRRFLARVVRQRMIELLRSPAAGQPSQERLRRVGFAVIETILDFSRDAQAYYHLLFDALGEPLPIGEAAANEWRATAMAMLYRLRRETESRYEPESPYAIEGRIRADSLTDRRLHGFVHRTAQQLIESQDALLGTAIDTLWAQVRRRPDTAGLPVDGGTSGWRVERLTVATSVDHYGDRQLSYRLDRDPEAAAGRSGNDYKVFDLFRPQAQRSRSFSSVTRAERPVFGVVCAVEHDTRTAWLNLGIGQPVRCALEEGDRLPQIGELIAAPLVGGEGRYEARRPILELRHARPRHGDARPAVISARAKYPWLSVVVDGRNDYPDDGSSRATQTRLRWDPDVLRHTRQSGHEKWHTLAEWDEELGHWVPADRSMAELLAVELASAASTGGSAALTFSGTIPDANHGDAGSPLRFTTTPGRSFALRPEDWTPQAWEDLEEALGDETPGLIVHVQLDPATVRLALSTGPAESDESSSPAMPFDERARTWLGLFSAGETAALPAVREAGEWWLRMSVPEGYPRISVTGIEHVRADRCLCSVDHWDEPQARAALVHAEVLVERGIKKAESPDTDRFDELSELEVGSVVTLEGTSGRDMQQDWVLGFTDQGLAVRVPTESITLCGVKDLNPFVRGRRARVEGDSVVALAPEREAEPVPPNRLAEDIVFEFPHYAAEVRTALESDETMGGLIVSKVRDEAGDAVEYGLWLDVGDQICLARVPESALDVGECFVGEHVYGSRSAAGWSFSAARRRVHVRGLYTQAARPGPGWKPVGLLTENGRHQVVRQSPDAPAVSVDANRGQWPASPSRVTRIAPNRRWRYRDISYMRVKVEQDGDALIGNAPEYPEGSRLRLLYPALDIRRHGGGAPGEDLFVVQRNFAVEATTAPQRRQESRDTAARLVERWREALEAGRHHLTGRHDGARFLPDNLKVPQTDGTWRTWLPLKPDEQPKVLGRAHYDNGQMRVRVLSDGPEHDYVASFDAAEPLTVAEFAELFGLPLGGPRRRFEEERLYYVGVEAPRDGEAVHRFEWGYGWCLDIPAQALIVGGAPLRPDSSSLFHGDRVRALRLVADEAVPGSIAVQVNVNDIIPLIEGQLFREAMKGVVHEVEVQVDVRRGRVVVVRAHTRMSESRATEDLQRTADHKITGTVDEDTSRTLLDAARREKDAGPLVTRRILARLHTDDLNVRNGRTRLFSLVPPRLAKDGEPGLKSGDLLYLEAVRIKEASNDVYLEFQLPASVTDPEGRLMKVRVNRRRFSFREELLRRVLADSGPRAYEGGAKMLVRLWPLEGRQSGDHVVWSGSTTDTLVRSRETLRSHIRHEGGSRYATMGRDGRVEIKPGVLFDLGDVAGAAAIGAGALVRLHQGGDGELRLDLAIPAQQSYVRRGRPVVVFPKNHLLREGGREKAATGAPFTLGGLPALEAGVQADLAAQLLATPHPKLMQAVFVKSGRTRLLIQPLDPRVLAGILVPDADASSGPATFDRRPANGSGETFQVAWARTSFADGGVADLQRACTGGTWSYHDTTTGHWAAGDAQATLYDVQPEATIAAEPVFFAEHGGPTLRYPIRDLPNYAFPASELLDRTALHGTTLTLAVAGSRANGLWLEMSPGRIADIPSGLFAANEVTLTTLDWSLFAPGDRIQVHLQQSRDKQYVSLDLLRWEPCLRGALGAGSSGRLALPVQYALPGDGALLLGVGRDTVKYPADPDTLDRHPVGGAVFLNRENDVTVAEPHDLRAGDVVLLGAGDSGEITLHGFPLATVALAPASRETWPGAQWLRDLLLAAAKRRELLSRLGGGLPVTIERAEVADGRLGVVVSRRHQPPGWWPRDRMVRTQIAANLGPGELILRSGAALLMTSADQIVGGAPQRSPQVARALSRLPAAFPLWWQVDRDGTVHPGLRAPEGSGTEVEVMVPVDDARGTDLGHICRDLRTSALCWLPARRAAWTPHSAAAAVAEQLAVLSPLHVVRLEDGSVSVIDQPMAKRERELLKVGSTLSVVACGGVLEPDPESGARRGLARTRFTNVLLTLVSEDEPAPGTELRAEVSAINSGPAAPVVECVPAGTRKVTPDMPHWLAQQLARLNLQPNTAPSAVKDLVPERFARYAAAFRAGPDGEDAADPAELLVRAAGYVYDDSHPEELRGAFTTWLRAGGLDTLRGRGECDLAPLLAACVVGEAIGRTDRAFARIAVFAAHQAGRRAARSLHVEPLVEEWLLRPERHLEPGGWQRVRTLVLGTHMSLPDLRSALDFSGAVLAKPVLEGSEDERAPVARALLMSVGQLANGERLADDAPRLASLAAWSRALSPPDDQAVAQDELLRPQAEVLRQLAFQVLTEAPPLTLLPLGPLPSAAKPVIDELRALATKSDKSD